MSTSSAMVNGRQGPSGMRLHQRYRRRVWKHDLKVRAVSFGAVETRL